MPPVFSHHLEWPAPGSRVRGPVAWLSGWIVGQPGTDFCDVRARHGGQVHLGILGFPRTDLATHFNSSRPWLPAEFVIGVPLPDGPAEICVEAQDSFGRWHQLLTLPVVVTPDGAESPRTVGRLETRPGGRSTARDAHPPFHGHLDDPKAEVVLTHGRAEIFGWLLHESQPIKAVRATTDLRVWHGLEHGVTDEALAAKVPALAGAPQARLRGAIGVPPTLTQPACLRIYAELADGSVHLCLAQRLTADFSPATRPSPPARRSGPAPAALPARSSGRPRRVLFFTLGLHRDVSTLRALDVARHLTSGSQWAVRLVTTADGPLRAAFESAGVAVQVINPQPFFSAGTEAAVESALAALGRQIWFRHLDAVAVFDESCLWAAALARSQQLPVLVDHSGPGPLVAPGRISAARGLANLLVFASGAASAHAGPFAEVPGIVVPHWHGGDLSARRSFTGDPRQRMVAPVRGTAEQGSALILQAADWLTRRHPEFTDRYRLAISDLRDTPEEELFLQDAQWNQPALLAVESTGLDCATACVCPGFAAPPVRQLLDAAAIGLPIITTWSPALAEIFPPHEVTYLSPGQPLALAHALADHGANPSAAQRRAEAAQRRVLSHHAPGALLNRWQAALEGMVAAAN